MKKITCFSMFIALLFSSVLFMFQAVGQQSKFSDAKSTLGVNYIAPAAHQDQGGSRNGCQYILDDGSQESSIGLTLGGDIMWLNYFTATAGCEVIHTISLTWGVMSNGGPCRLFIYEDPDDDGNPDDAVLLIETGTTVVNANTNIFTNVSITPTAVSGGFFIAALYQNQPSGEYPCSMDETSYQANSWIAGAETAGTFDVNILTNNILAPVLIGDLGFGGNWLLRAEGSAQEVPVSDWAVIIGILLISGFSIYRFRRILF